MRESYPYQQPAAGQYKYYAMLLFILILSAALRFLFYLGPSGADDMIYFSVVDDLLGGRT
jgi:hypothetical protein